MRLDRERKNEVETLSPAPFHRILLPIFSIVFCSWYFPLYFAPDIFRIVFCSWYFPHCTFTADGLFVLHHVLQVETLQGDRWRRRNWQLHDDQHVWTFQQGQHEMVINWFVQLVQWQRQRWLRGWWEWQWQWWGHWRIVLMMMMIQELITLGMLPDNEIYSVFFLTGTPPKIPKHI